MCVQFFTQYCFKFQGQFGEVFRGVFKLTESQVAVKTCRENMSEDVKRKFLQEGRILKQYNHPNIVKFIGIAAQRHPVMIVMEFVSGAVHNRAIFPPPIINIINSIITETIFTVPWV